MLAVLLVTPDVAFCVWMTAARWRVRRPALRRPRPRSVADEIEEWLAQQ